MWAETYTVDRAAVTRCDCCGLRALACVCDCLPPMALPFPLELVLHPNEFKRPTSSSRFLSMFQTIRLKEFKRDSLDIGLMNPFLLFPALDDQTQELVITDELSESEQTLIAQEVTERGILVIDGTWKECRKMLRQSPKLQRLDTIRIVSSEPSHYPFRKNQQEGGMSTGEALAYLCNAIYKDNKINSNLKHYYLHAIASQNGHKASC